MALSRPTLADLRTRAIADIQSALRLSGTLGPFLSALGYAVAGAAHGLYGAIDYISLQMTPATATGVWLARWASLWRYYRKPAAVAAGRVRLSGTPDTLVADGLTLQSGTGTVYQTTEGGTIDASGTISVALESNARGADGNQYAGAALMLISPALGLTAEAVVDIGGITGGRNVETDDELRPRLILRISNPPHGGNAADYELWALEVPGVTRAWCFPLYNGDGSVRVYVGESDPDGTQLASAETVAAALEHVESLRPVSYSDLSVVAPNIVAQDHEIHLVPNTADTQTAVIAELAALYQRDVAPEGEVFLSRINEAISIAAGESDHTLVSPTENPQAGAGQILTLGAVTFV